MRFNHERAEVFGEYTLTALLRDLRANRKGKGKYLLSVRRSDLAKILGAQKLWPQHIENIRKAAVEWGVGIANLGQKFVFFQMEDLEHYIAPMNRDYVSRVTDDFEKVYGSKAADEMWEDRSYGKKGVP